jgi:hypothetical protein
MAKKEILDEWFASGADSEYKEGKLNSIRNPEGIWINSSVFREEGDHFMKHGYYCADPWGSPAWYDYWEEQRNRCIIGYTVGGVKVTGDHYSYLNFCPIQKAEDAGAKRTKKIKGFPDFWDGDYNYFWIREIARYGVFEATEEGHDDNHAFLKMDTMGQAVEMKKRFESLKLEVVLEADCLSGGWNLIVGKSRRKGYSYKSAAAASRNYFTKPNSYTIFAAYEKKYLYPKGLLTMAVNNINFMNGNTGWAMPSDVVQKQDHIRASYIQYKNGIKLEKGFMSEIQGLTFKDNADAARGKDAEEVYFEESGAFGTPGLLKKAYKATEDCVMAGAIKTGMITIFGTSGDMQGGTADYADMHSRPKAFGLLPFKNIWDEDMESTVSGFFHPITWNMEGQDLHTGKPFYDKQGNSDKVAADRFEMEYRAELVKNGATSTEIQARMQEKPRGPGEAFASVSVNNFPVVELKKRLQLVKGKQLHKTHATPVELYMEKGQVKTKMLLDGKATPIDSYNNVPTDKRGVVQIYEQPIYDPPKGLYKIGYDPVRQDIGPSLAAIIVYKSVHTGSLYHNIIVAEYIGRRESPEDMDRIAAMLAKLYNTQIMHENEVTGVKNYFRRTKQLHLLAAQPDAVISKNIKKSKVARVFGCHMNEMLKDAGERYVKEWLLTVLDFDENGDPVTVIDRIYSVRMLEELIAYNRKGNFDLLSAFFMCMFQVQEETLGKEHSTNKKNKNAKKLLQMMDKMHKKN